MEEDKNRNKHSISRREVIKNLATVPVLGAVAYGLYKKRTSDQFFRNSISEELNMSTDSPMAAPVSEGKEIRIGLIGFGIRGKQLAAGLGFVHPDQVDEWFKASQSNPNDTRYQAFREQGNLNIRITGVCDIYDTYGRMAQEAAANVNREGAGGKMGDPVRRYLTYKELLVSPEIDAVVIATPDHWHGPITIDAARAGKHVYCEKPMTWTVDETYEVRRAVKESGIIFQLGHQGRQTDSYLKAKEAVQKNVLGQITLIEVTTNRNDPNGAWVYPIPKDAGPSNIDWKQFIGQAPWHDFSLERFFRWRCWWDYSTGLSGDLLTHEYDAMNQILDLGIPASAASTGGIYFFKDGRTVPDVLTTVFEFPGRNMSLLYSATLASQMSRGKKVMGHDAYMEFGNTLTIYADPGSTRYAEKIKQGIIKEGIPIYSYIPGKGVDAVSSATELYFANRGLLYTYRGGRRVDTTHLHLQEWIDGIRKGVQPSCNIDRGFEEAMTAHMGTLSYHTKKQVFWDYGQEKILV
ncbi:MAG TPA: Gfo/Idh/MocA family oxidoreductase [Bacteroidales bacterium]|nr:Gfo/Idh/MocA family oxidoreductase [Bacteroidales bacterium]